MSSTASSSAAACRGTRISSSSVSLMPSSARCQPARSSTPSSTTTPPIAPEGPSLARPAFALGVPLHPDLQLLAQRRRDLLLLLTRRRLRRGIFRSIVDLQAAINRYLDEHNANPKPFVWSKPADTILAKLKRLPVPSV